MSGRRDEKGGDPVRPGRYQKVYTRPSRGVSGVSVCYRCVTKDPEGSVTIFLCSSEGSSPPAAATIL